MFYLLYMYIFFNVCFYWNKVYQGFANLMNILTHGRSNMSILLWLFFGTDEACVHRKLKHNTDKDDLQLFISLFITVQNIAGI